MPLDPQRVKALFQAAIALTDPAQRANFVARQTGDDAELRDRLRALLEGYEDPPAVFQSNRTGDAETQAETADLSRTIADAPGICGDDPAETVDVDETCATEQDETRAIDPPAPGRDDDGDAPALDALIAGRYRLRQEIGEGGMGSVYLADQVEPIKRKVALKLIKPGMDSRTVLARFEGERQALALMDHPHIAKVLDAGTTEQGRPFFVMELVKGIPLTDYCDRHRLGVAERLNLFRQVCSAVQHAHQKGGIHRDLKPTNILVESHDGKPVPKVIDFGVAKAFGGMSLTDHTLCTAFGAITGTPLYMAPEQAMFNALDVDTRVDIYALGVILYELPTGSTPIQRESIRRAAIDEMRRVIREVEPPTPSSRISTSEALPNLAANRHAEPARLSRLIKGDLDWIVMKALAKERARWYDSAIGLGNDVERYLNHEPVTAGPPGAAYRVRKFVRRNRGQVIAASLSLVVLVGGVIGTSLGLREAKIRRDRARDEAHQKDIARLHEAEQRRLVESKSKDLARRLGQMAKLNDWVCSIFSDIDPKSLKEDRRPLSALLGERLERVVAELDGEVTGDIDAATDMQYRLADALLGLGHTASALEVLIKVHVTRLSRLGPKHLKTLEATNSLAMAYQDVGQSSQALELFQEVLAERKAKLGADHVDTLESMNNLAVSFVNNRQSAQALPLFQEVLSNRKIKLGPDHPKVLSVMKNIAGVYSATGQYDRALPLHQEVLESYEKKLGDDHLETLDAMDGLGFVYWMSGKLDRGLPLLQEVLASRKRKLGPNHPDTLGTMGDLARAYERTGQVEQALPLHREIFASHKANLGPDHPETVEAAKSLALAHLTAGHFDQTLQLLEEVFAIQKIKLGPDHLVTMSTKHLMAMATLVAGQLDQSLSHFKELAVFDRTKFGPSDPMTLRADSYFAIALLHAGKPEEASVVARELAATLALRRSQNLPNDRDIVALLAFIMLGTREWSEAEALLREVVTSQELTHPDVWTTYYNRVMLGAALCAQRKFAEAEPLLRSGYSGLVQRRGRIYPFHSALPWAPDWLIAFGEATGKPDDVAKWKAERAKIKAHPSAIKPEIAQP